MMFPKLQTKRNDWKMSMYKNLEKQLSENSYYLYAKQYDSENDTNYAEQIEFYAKRRLKNEYMNEQTETVTNDKKFADKPTTIQIDGKRNVIGNYSNNTVMIEKTLMHMNSLKRSMSLSFQSDDENARLMHENNMFRELLNLELSLRTMKTNIKRDEQNK